MAAYFMPVEKNWTPSFSKVHNWPFGGEILFNELEVLFPENEIITNDKALYELREEDSLEPGAMILIAERLSMDSLDSQILMDYIGKGNQVFMAANEFPYAILDSMDIVVESDYFTNDIIKEGFEAKEIGHHVNFNELPPDSLYNFELDRYYHYFISEFDSLDHYNSLGWTNSEEHTNFVHFKIGDGDLFLHSNPFLFTNFYILSESGRGYLSAVFSHLKNGNIYWDENYKGIHRTQNKDQLQVIMAETPLRWAMYLSVFAIGLILFFMSKRRQRIIPELDAYRNDSKELVETIGQLYFNTSDNRNISKKKISLYKQEVFRKYRVNDSMKLAQKIELLNAKTAVDKSAIEKLYMLMGDIESNTSVTDGQLKILNTLANKILNKTK